MGFYDAQNNNFKTITYGRSDWKDSVKKFFGTRKLLFWHHKEATDASVKKSAIFLSLADVGTAVNEALSDRDDVFFLKNEDDGSIVPKELLSFMFLSTEAQASSGEDLRATVNPEVLQKSFECAVTSTGHDSIDSLKAGILAHFIEWAKERTDKYAPIASLSQGSGSGKSKLAVETLKDGPGFYIVFRSDDLRRSTGYPKKNALSDRLKSLLLQPSDSLDDLTKLLYSELGIGKILMFFAKVITVVLREWATRIQQMHQRFPTDTIEVCVRSACAELGSMFDKNDEFDCSPLLNQSLEREIAAKIISHKPAEGIKVITVGDVAGYIKDLLHLKSWTLPDAESSLNDVILEAMKSFLSAFPFLFVLDEADELDDKALPKRSPSSIQILRRALSYLTPGTRIFFLTLGTKSDIYDLNPPLIENSGRSLFRTKSFQPIILLSNTSIFSKSDLPLEKLKLDQTTLTNPVMFKYLVTPGHPIWSSIPFDQIISLAEEKLLNGSAASFKYVLVIWMIRAGLMASPTDLNTRTLIASHMATLFDLSPDLMKMVVFYPSEPILAIACRNLLRDRLFDSPNIVQLFQKLTEFFEAVDFDQGNLVGVIGSMLVLLAIDQAKGSERPCSTPDQLKALIEELDMKMPDFKWLWEKNRFVLEPDGAAGTETCYQFPHYHIVTVEHFLCKLLDAQKFEDLKPRLPESTLKGLVNASHAVKVVRTDNQMLRFANTTFEPMKLPVADDRITDKYCNVIDESMLKLGLAQQCMFLMPANYFAYDLVVPLMLEDGSVSFIGIQFKANGKDIADVITGMQARFHYVKCPKAGTAGHECSKCAPSRCASFAEPDHSCPSCIGFNRLAALYSNQISLYISLDSFNTSDFSQSITTVLSDRTATSRFLSGPEKSLVECLTKPLDQVEAVLNEIGTKSGSFLKPLVGTRRWIGDCPKMSLISSLWRDANRIMGGGSEPDPFIHRLFCIATRGFEVFKHLLNSDDTVKVAVKLINNSVHFFQRLRRQDSESHRLQMLKAILYDGRINYLDYNYDLARMRGLTDTNGYLELLEAAKQYYKQTYQQSSDCFADCLPSKNRAAFHIPRTSSGPFRWSFRSVKKVESSAIEASAIKSSALESSAPESFAPEASATESSVPESTAPQAFSSSSSAPQASSSSSATRKRSTSSGQASSSKKAKTSKPQPTEKDPH